jgi:hypothetical protein
VDEDDLRERGVPEALLPYTTWNPDPCVQDEFIPIVWLPDGWSRTQKPSLEDLHEAVNLGMGLCLNGQASEPFDLAWLRACAHSVRLLWCASDPARMRNVDLIRDMTSLVSLISPVTDDGVDVSGLPQLQRAIVKGRGFLSALKAPVVVDAYVEIPAFGPEIAVSPSIEWLFIRARDVDTAFTRTGLPRLRTLYVEGAGAIDLTGLEIGSALEVVGVFDYTKVTGIRSLSTLPHLRELKLMQLKAIDQPRALLDVHAEQMSAENCRDLDAGFAADAAQRGSRWEITPPKTTSSALFRVSKAIDGRTYEITFSDWGWLQLNLPSDLADRMSTSSDLGEILRRVAGESESAGSISYELDSEGDAFIAITSTRSDALTLRRTWQKFLRDSTSP